ncbi:DUF5819 family protein [Streptomyces sp. AM8-1-1]|uniref:DUF5819 family protein n=1 Tax=Streptomyces sp. AM8-1-1 TaxID=3075825 RepID=UPI0028C39653|nr:DUF5819 family protein [Streptomyces sp. AM8-1-1]WNO73495.1 DUF5819 family protein [Streptomyces sp. AM8-1-1]
MDDRRAPKGTGGGMDSYNDEDAEGAATRGSAVPPDRAAGPVRQATQSSQQPSDGPQRASEGTRDSSADQDPLPAPGDGPSSAVRAEPRTGAPQTAEPAKAAVPGPRSGTPHEDAFPSEPDSFPSDPDASSPDPDPDSAPLDPDAPTGGIAALSLPYQVAVAVSLALIAVLAGVHVAMVFLHVAPANTASKEYGKAIDAWVYPEFEQNWKLFAPNPLQQNVAVQVKAEVTTADGDRRSTGWIDLSAEDGDAIRGNLLPSHTQQNALRRAWDFYINSHDDKNRSSGLRGQLSESYVRRLVMARLERHDVGGEVERIQLRSSTSAVKPPDWSNEKFDLRPQFRVLPWWTVTAADLPGGVDNGRTEADR